MLHSVQHDVLLSFWAKRRIPTEMLRWRSAWQSGWRSAWRC